MAMDGDILGQAIADAIALEFGPMAAADKAKIVTAWKIAGVEIVKHIKALAEVAVSSDVPAHGAGAAIPAVPGTGSITA